jgi:hypothetical protein
MIYKRSIQYRRPIFQLFVDWTGTTLYSLSLFLKRHPSQGKKLRMATQS